MNCKDGTKAIITQILNLLEQLDNATLLKPLEIFGGSTLGQHFRHIFDFYQCLLQGTLDGEIDYASRERNPFIEADVAFAAEAFEALLPAIARFEDDLELMIRGDFSIDHASLRPQLQSSFGRELMYAYDHAVHHLAMIKIGLKTGFPQVVIDQNVGVAPSTIKFQSGH